MLGYLVFGVLSVPLGMRPASTCLQTTSLSYVARCGSRHYHTEEAEERSVFRECFESLFFVS